MTKGLAKVHVAVKGNNQPVSPRQLELLAMLGVPAHAVSFLPWGIAFRSFHTAATRLRGYRFQPNAPELVISACTAL